MSVQNLIKAVALTTVVASFTAGAAMATDTHATTGTEKCYGIAKAGKNDCASGQNKCAGSAKMDKQADAFIALPKGACEKIAGASLEAK